MSNRTLTRSCTTILVAAVLWMLVPFVAPAAYLVTARAESITWWHWYPPEIWVTYEPLIEEFEAATGIDVQTQYFGWSRMHEKLVIGMAGGIFPDVITVSSRWADTLAMRESFRDLAELEEPATFEALRRTFFPVALELWQTVDGKQYALPLDLDVPLLFYNAEIFNESGTPPPATLDWDSWFDLTRRLGRDVDGDELLDLFGLTTWWYPWITLVWTNGGTLVNADRTGLALGEPLARDAIEYYRRLKNEGPIPGSADALRLGTLDPSGLWKEGRVGMAPAGAWMPRYHLTTDGDPGSYVFEYGMTHLPSGPTGIRAASAEGSGLAVVNGSTQQDAAWRLVSYVASEEFTRRVASQLEGFPAVISVARDTFMESGEDGQILMEVVDYARPFPKGVQWWERLYPTVQLELGRYIEGIGSLQGAIENIERQTLPWPGL